MRMVMVNGLGRGTASVFSDPVSHGMGPSYLPRTYLGASGAQWYQRAESAVAQFQTLVNRTAKIANKTSRDEVVAWVGDEGDDSSPRYRYNSVIWDLNRAKSYTPLNTTEFDRSQLQNRVTKLESFNQDFAGQVKTAEDYYGILPEPVVIERFTNVTVPSESSSLTTPLLIAAGLVLAAGIFMLIKKS